MGNCLTLYNFYYYKDSCGVTAEGEQHKVVQVVKMDGKILEFTAAILVKDLLANFPGSGIRLSKRNSDCLPHTSELKLGNLYFLFPLLCPVETEKLAVIQSEEVETEQPPSFIKTIKVVITKKQLHDLVSKKTTLDSVLSEINTTTTTACSLDSPKARAWKPGLEPIPEVNEFDF